ncbi:MAG: ATP-binding cassette domain-containing protein [Pseudomonadota bacterium]
MIAELRSVSVDIGERRILHDVDLKIPSGTIVAAIGASGSGKSTLLRLFNGLQHATDGLVMRNGQRIEQQSLREVRFNTGYALQQIALLPHLSVRDNIALPMRIAGRTDHNTTTRVQQLSGRMQLTEAQLDRYPAQLSGGQQQRAGICRALALAPQLLLLDEAFSGLDAITRSETHAQFLAMRGDEINSCLLVTHDLAEAKRLADYFVILSEGRIVRQGPRDDVLRDPQDPYAARLIEQCL